MLITGALVLADVGEFNHFIEGRVLAPPIVLIVVGALVFLVASLGCYGAIRESPPLLMMVSLCNEVGGEKINRLFVRGLSLRQISTLSTI